MISYCHQKNIAKNSSTYSIIIIAVHLVVCSQGRRNALKHRLAQNFQKAPRSHRHRNLSGLLASQVGSAVPVCNNFTVLNVMVLSQTSYSNHRSIDDFTIAGSNKVLSAGRVGKFNNCCSVIIDINIPDISGSCCHSGNTFKTHHGRQVGDQNPAAHTPCFGNFVCIAHQRGRSI